MPIYEYKCLKCGSSFEILQKVNDLPLEKCPKCGGQLHKVISPPALQFKGHGWYVTDYGHHHEVPANQKKIKEKEQTTSQLSNPAPKNNNKNSK